MDMSRSWTHRADIVLPQYHVTYIGRGGEGGGEFESIEREREREREII